MNRPPRPSPQLVLAMLADARLPTGAHAHSAGLEPAVLAGVSDGGRRLWEVPALARSRLRTVTATEAGTAVVARRHHLEGRSLSEVEDAWSARTPSGAARAASRQLGRGYLRLARGLWSDTVGAAFDGEPAPPRPLVLGVLGAVTGLTARQVAQLVGYDDVQTIASAALKLIPLDPVVAARWVLELHADIEVLADEVERLTVPTQIPARGAPVLDGDAERHAVAARRLFHA
ncbi:Urease accessory protein UreF [metagenome]|uniref:Urease accessory protein UreF n=1 Tax=metagenome TaxID=256318 RepID=A0A2P2C7G6_9ZZZZ